METHRICSRKHITPHPRLIHNHFSCFFPLFFSFPISFSTHLIHRVFLLPGLPSISFSLFSFLFLHQSSFSLRCWRTRRAVIWEKRKEKKAKAEKGQPFLNKTNREWERVFCISLRQDWKREIGYELFCCFFPEDYLKAGELNRIPETPPIEICHKCKIFIKIYIYIYDELAPNLNPPLSHILPSLYCSGFLSTFWPIFFVSVLPP